MCDFHSILGVALGDTYEIFHNADNSHSGMSGDCANKPNRAPIIFEVEASAELLLQSDNIDFLKPSIIRNYSECPEPLVKKIVTHYKCVKEALTDGRHLTKTGYFADTKKFSDVWSKAIEQGIKVTLPEVFVGDLAVNESAKLDATALAEVVGNLEVNESAKLAAPELAKVGGNLEVNGSAKLDAPVLAEVGGTLVVYASAKLAAPDLAKVGGNLVVYESAKLDAPALAEVGGNLAVSDLAKLDAPALAKVGGNLVVYESAKLDAPALTAVGGNLDDKIKLAKK